MWDGAGTIRFLQEDGDDLLYYFISNLTVPDAPTPPTCPAFPAFHLYIHRCKLPLDLHRQLLPDPHGVLWPPEVGRSMIYIRRA